MQTEFELTYYDAAVWGINPPKLSGLFHLLIFDTFYIGKVNHRI